MTMFWILIACLLSAMFGAGAGFALCALCASAKRADDEIERRLLDVREYHD